MKLSLLALLSALVFFSGCATDSGSGGSASPGVSTSGTPSGGSGTGTSAPRFIPADLLRVGDVLTISLTGVPAEEQQRFEQSVNDRGEISMPMVGNFKASGRTISDLTASIITAYKEKRIYNNPSVLIVNQIRFVNVGGEVRLPQRIAYTNDLTALKAISACGYFTDYAEKKNIKISRGQEIILFNAVESQKDPSLDVPLQAGDQIQVSRTVF